MGVLVFPFRKTISTNLAAESLATTPIQAQKIVGVLVFVSFSAHLGAESLAATPIQAQRSWVSCFSQAFRIIGYRSPLALKKAIAKSSAILLIDSLIDCRTFSLEP